MVDLPGLRGKHSQREGLFELPVDAGRTFSRITRVRLHIEGNARPGEAKTQDGSAGVLMLPVSFQLMLADSFRDSISLNSPVARLGPFDLSFTDEQEFYGQTKGADWTFLKDGQATLRFSWGTDCPGACRYIEYPSVDVYDAYVSIEGVPAD